jgi:hypothetical protein
MTIKALLLVGALSLAAASAVHAGGHGTSGDFHANAAPAGGTARSRQIPALWRRVLAGGRVTGSDFHANAAPVCDTNRCPLLAGDGGPTGAGEGSGRSMALSTVGGAAFRVAGGSIDCGDQF